MSEPKRARKAPAHILVVGSINVDLYQRLDKGAAKFAGKSLSIKPIKGMTLPAANFQHSCCGRRLRRDWHAVCSWR